MSIATLLSSRVVYAALLGVTLVVGTFIGGAVQQASNPAFDRIVWLEQDVASTSRDSAVRRVLFADGRFVALAADGYRAGVVDAAQTAEIFATVRSKARSWASAYGSNGPIGEQIELTMDGQGPVHVTIANPGMNFGLPSELGRLLRLLSAADGSIAEIPFSPSSLRFSAVSAPAGAGEPVDALPSGFPLALASQAGGVVLGGQELSTLRSTWTDLEARLDPASAHRFVEVDGQTWRISWTLDIDGIGVLPGSNP